MEGSIGEIMISTLPPVDLAFSYNWNNKLNSKSAFSTMRLSNDKFIVGRKVNVSCKGIESFQGIIVVKKPFHLKNLNDAMAYLDTGYNAEETRKIILKMYQSVDFSIKQLDFLVIKKL